MRLHPFPQAQHRNKMRPLFGTLSATCASALWVEPQFFNLDANSKYWLVKIDEKYKDPIAFTSSLNPGSSSVCRLGYETLHHILTYANRHTFHSEEPICLRIPRRHCNTFYNLTRTHQRCPNGTHSYLQCSRHTQAKNAVLSTKQSNNQSMLSVLDALKLRHIRRTLYAD